MNKRNDLLCKQHEATQQTKKTSIHKKVTEISLPTDDDNDIIRGRKTLVQELANDKTRDNDRLISLNDAEKKHTKDKNNDLSKQRTDYRYREQTTGSRIERTQKVSAKIVQDNF